MRLNRIIAIGKIASLILALFAMFYGAYAFFMFAFLIIGAISILLDGVPLTIGDVGWLLFLAFSLLVAATPFAALRFFFLFKPETSHDPTAQRLARQVGWMMTVVAGLWAYAQAMMIYNGEYRGEPIAQTILQSILLGSPAVFAGLSAWAAFRTTKLPSKTSAP